MAIKLLIFDFDGTLYHSAPSIHKAINLMLAARKFPAVSMDQTVDMIGQGFEGLAEQLKNHAGAELTEEIIVDEFRKNYKSVFQESKPYPGVLEFLRSWKGQMAVCSNKPRYFLERLVKNGEIAEFNWVSVVGGDTFRVKKPDPLPINHCVEQAGVKHSETLMIGDGLPDILGAKAAGIRSIAVGHGYSHLQILKDAGADFGIPDIAGLKPLLETLQR